MYGRLGEEIAWTRLQDRQREIENAQLYGGGLSLKAGLGLLLQRVWLLAGLSIGRASRRRPDRSQKTAY